MAGACARTRDIERSDGSPGSAQEAVIYVARVNVVSRDRPEIVDIKSVGALPGAVPAPVTSNVVITPFAERTKL